MFVSVFLSHILTIIQPKCSLTHVFVSLSYDSDFDSDDDDDDYYYYHDHTQHPVYRQELRSLSITGCRKSIFLSNMGENGM